MADISRAQIATLIQEAYSHVLLDAAVTTSAVLQAFPVVNMGTKLTHLPVLATTPAAAWVTENADATGVKQTSIVAWADLTLVAEEIAVIIPLHEDAMMDASVDLLTEITVRGGEAIGEVLDAAIMFGTNKPASWVSNDLRAGATAAANNVTSTALSATASYTDLVGAVNSAARKIANAGLVPDTILAPLTLRYDVENIRDQYGNPIFRNEQFAGYKTTLSKNAAWVGGGGTSGSVSLFVADSSRIRIGVRQDIQVKILDQATLGTVNLAERDMIGVRMKARYAYVLGVSATRRQAAASPVAAVISGGS
jgi:HK97 family phage major capsid protein